MSLLTENTFVHVEDSKESTQKATRTYKWLATSQYKKGQHTKINLHFYIFVINNCNPKVKNGTNSSS